MDVQKKEGVFMRLGLSLIKDKKGDAMIYMIIFFIFVSGIMIVGMNNLFKMATEKAIIHNAAATASSQIQWMIIKSMKGQSQNDKDSKHIKPNMLEFNEDEAKNAVINAFAQYGYEIDNVSVTLNDYTFVIEGDVKLKTKNTTAVSDNERQKVRYFHIKYTDRIFKNHGEQA